MPYRPSPRQLEYLVALGETGHFGAAARKCHVSQPTLSVQVQLLEDHLGTVLIDRTPGNVTPTPTGRAVMAAARQILTGLDDIVRLAATSRTNLGGSIRLGVAPTFGPYFLPYLLPRVHQRYRELKIYIREERPASLDEAVSQGDTDCALGPLPDDSDAFSTFAICDERVFLGVPKDHPLAGRAVVEPAELAGENLLTLGRGHKLVDNVRELALISGAHLVEDYEGTSLDALRQMVSIEMGLSLFPELYVRSEFRKEDNVRLLAIRHWPVNRRIGFYWRRGSVRQHHFEALAALGKDIVESLLSRAAEGLSAPLPA